MRTLYWCNWAGLILSFFIATYYAELYMWPKVRFAVIAAAVNALAVYVNADA